MTDGEQDVETKIVEAQAPIDALDEDFKHAESELSARILQAQNSSQELNIAVDKLNQANKGVERYECHSTSVITS